MRQIAMLCILCGNLALASQGQIFEQSRSAIPSEANRPRSLTAGPNFRYAAKRSMPCVVYIDATLPLLSLRESSSSGVIVSSNGYIVTNYHAIANAIGINVTLPDQQSYLADLIGADSVSDLALLHIRETGLAYIEFADSDSAEVGDWVLAVGNPLDLPSTVTSGIISAKTRNLNTKPAADALDCYIQTDAVANPGSSGGALVDIDGRLVGITSAIESSTGTFAGYSFAIPANIVKKVVNDLFRWKKVQWASLGISVSNINGVRHGDSSGLYLPGVLIDDLNRHGAAFEGGLAVGDVIVRLDDKPITSDARFREVLAEYHPGDKILVAFLRRGQEFRLVIPLQLYSPPIPAPPSR